MENTKWVLKERPIGLVKDSDFELIKEEVGELNDQEILLENLYLSFDPTRVGSKDKYKFSSRISWSFNSPTSSLINSKSESLTNPIGLSFKTHLVFSIFSPC